jgi:signal transduction histidine kinase
MKEADQVRLEVADTGYGIPANAQEKIFTEFYRARTAATAHIGGTGLGLSLVKAVVDDHSGRIYFESTEGVGTTFYVELPTTEKTEETG